MTEAVRILLRGLVDDAGLFPPTVLPMGQALARYRADRTVGSPLHTGCFVCPASRLPELRDTLGERERIDVGLVVDTEQALLGGGVDDPRIRVAHYETRAPGIDVGKAARYLRTMVRAAEPRRRGLFLRRAPRPAVPAARRPVYVELDGAGGDDVVAALAGAPGLGATINCGGHGEETAAGPEKAAAAIVACVDHGVPFRIAAGPHHAVRHTDPSTGLVRLGYLNLLLATAVAVTGGGPNKARRALLVDDPDELVARVGDLGTATATRVRESFVGYGSCSTRDPVVDAERFGLLDPLSPQVPPGAC